MKKVFAVVSVFFLAAVLVSALGFGFSLARFQLSGNARMKNDYILFDRAHGPEGSAYVTWTAPFEGLISNRTVLQREGIASHLDKLILEFENESAYIRAISASLVPEGEPKEFKPLTLHHVNESETCTITYRYRADRASMRLYETEFWYEAYRAEPVLRVSAPITAHPGNMATIVVSVENAGPSEFGFDVSASDGQWLWWTEWISPGATMYEAWRKPLIRTEIITFNLVARTAIGVSRVELSETVTITVAGPSIPWQEMHFQFLPVIQN